MDRFIAAGRTRIGPRTPTVARFIVWPWAAGTHVLVRPPSALPGAPGRDVGDRVRPGFQKTTKCFDPAPTAGCVGPSAVLRCASPFGWTVQAAAPATGAAMSRRYGVPRTKMSTAISAGLNHAPPERARSTDGGA